MIQDVANKHYEVEVDGADYLLEYDNAAYAQAELVTGKGLFGLYNDLVVKNNMMYKDFVEIFCCGLLKNHQKHHIADVRKYLKENTMQGLKYLLPVTLAFSQPLMPPEIMQKAQEKALKKKKSVKTKK